MARLRRILGPVVTTWLLCHVAGLTVAPASFLFTAATDPIECTCANGDHTICPMHHRPASGTRCSIRGASDSGTALLTTLLPIGILTSTTATIFSRAAVTFLRPTAAPPVSHP